MARDHLAPRLGLAMLIPFGAWAPDAIPTAKGVTHTLSNVLPDDALGTYRPAPSLAAETELPAPVIGGIMARSGATAVPYVGTGAGLYSITSAVNDLSKPGGYAINAPNRWRFAQYKNQVIAASIDAPVQAVTVGGPAFADLIVSTRKPKASVLAVIAREWLVLGDTTDSVDGRQINRVWWSRAGDITRFDPDNQYFCGLQDLDASGAGIVAISGVEYATVVMRKDIWRMTPDTSVENGMRFDRLDPGNGALAPGAVVPVGRRVFYLSERGPMVFDGTQSAPIGSGQWAQWLGRNLNTDAIETICGVLDPYQHLIFWFVPTGSATLPSRAIAYNYVSNLAAPLDVAVEFAFASETSATYLESARVAESSLDTGIFADFPVDSRAFDGGAGLVYGVDRAHKYGPFAGAPGRAVLETGEIALDGLAYVDRCLPIVSDCENAPRVKVGTRGAIARVGIEYTALQSLGLDHAVHPFVAGHYARFCVVVDGVFSRAFGVEAEFTPAGGV